MYPKITIKLSIVWRLYHIKKVLNTTNDAVINVAKYRPKPSGPQESLPRLNFRRRSNLPGQQLTVLIAIKTSFRCSGPDVSKIICLLRVQQKIHVIVDLFVDPTGLEPATSSLQMRRSSQMS